MSLTKTITEGTIDGVLIEEFTDFYRDEYAGHLNEIIHHDSPSLTIDHETLNEYDEDLADGLIYDPVEYYYSAREALRTIATRDSADEFIDGAPYEPIEEEGDDLNPLAYADLRIENNPNTKTVRSLRADDVTTMIAIEGRVKKRTQVQPRVDVAVFKCTTCGKLHYEDQPLVGEMEMREKCNSSNCSSETVFDWHESHHVNFERLEIEESPEGLSGGETPETIDFYNRGDTAGRVNPGERVTVTGILEPADDNDSKGKPEVVFDTRLNGNNIVREEEAFEDIEITEEDIEEIEELADGEEVYEKVKSSIAPAIYGYDMQKFALALALFGGVKKEVSGSYVRGDIHTIFVGDPSTGKTVGGETEILNEENQPETIKSFVNRYMNNPQEDEDGDLIEVLDEYVEVPTLGEHGERDHRSVEAVWKKDAPDTAYRMVTESENTIRASDTHPLFVHDGNGNVTHKNVGELEPGDYIAKPRHDDAGYGSDDENGSPIEDDIDPIPNGGSLLNEVRCTMNMEQGELGLPRAMILGYENEEKCLSRARAKVVVEAFERRLGELERVATADNEQLTWAQLGEVRENLGLPQRKMNTSSSFSQGAVVHQKQEDGDLADEAAIEDVRSAARHVYREAVEKVHKFRYLVESDIKWERVETVEEVEYEQDWMYDLQVEGTHAYIGNDIFNHNSQLLEYAHDIAPRGVYTSGKGSSSAGLCVGGDTFIETENGFEQISSIVPEQLRRTVSDPKGAPLSRSVATYDCELDSFSSRDTSKAWKMPKQKTVEITTERGKEVTVSANTPLLVYRQGEFEWVEADKLQASDRLAQSPPIVTNRRSLDPRGFYEPDDEMIDSAAKEDDKLSLTEEVTCGTLSNRFVPYSSASVAPEGGVSNVSVQDTTKFPETFDRELMWLVGVVLGSWGADSRTEQNLVRVTNSNRELLERCAGIMGRKFGKRPDVQESKDDELPHIRLHGEKIQQFFKNLSRSHSKDGSLSLAPELTVAENADALLAGLFEKGNCLSNADSEKLSFTSASEDLAKQVQLMLETYDVYAHVREREVGAQCSEWVVEISGSNIDEFAESTGSTLTKETDILNGMCKETTRGTRSQYADATNSAVVLEPIDSIETGEEELFDLTVPGTHSFFGNGVCIHNTAAAVQEESLSGETTWTLEAGALPLADKGVAAIDEIDKMDNSDRDSLHEALESQTISINKAGINATLKARASVMAAANPKYGQFDQYEAISEQVELDPALISRFDLIFTITDDPDEDMDEEIAEHIIKTNQSDQQEEADEAVTAAIEPGLFRKYVAHARNNCYPTLPDEVGKYLKEYYVELRQKGDEGVRPATARQLQGLVRLAEASARIRLSDTVTMDDAKLAKNVIEKSMEDVAMDPETGKLDADIVEGGMSSSQSERIKTVKRLIEELQDEYDEGVPKEEIQELANSNFDEEVSMDKLDESLEQLRREGEVYEPNEGQYKIVA